MNLKQMLVLGGWLCLSAGLLRLSSQKIALLQKDMQAKENGPLLSWADSRVVNILSLGHRHLYEDYIYLWLLQYLISDVNGKREPVEQLTERINAVFYHKPRIESVYLLACFVLGLDYKRPDLCEPISVLGLQVFPNSWRIPMTQGYMFAFPLAKPLQAAFYYHLAASRPHSPPYVASLTKKLLEKKDWSPQERQEVLKSILSIPKGKTFKTLLPKQTPAKKS